MVWAERYLMPALGEVLGFPFAEDVILEYERSQSRLGLKHEASRTHAPVSQDMYQPNLI